jgi:aldose 1-epimerase
MLSATGGQVVKRTGITQQEWGDVQGKRIELFILKNRHGLQADITNYGGILTALHVPDRKGELADVVLGFDSLTEYRMGAYLSGNPYFGALIGRVANRTARGQFTLGEEMYQLPINKAPNHLHGGNEGFDQRVWRAQPEVLREGQSLVLSYLSPDGEEGYPGNMLATAIYTLTEDNVLRLDLIATTDRATPVNLTNHSYFNLAGHAAGSILKHELTLDSPWYTPTDDSLIPTGEILAVQGTPFDFTTPKTIGADIAHPTIRGIQGGGYDTNFVVAGQIGNLRRAARLYEASSGRVMEIHATHPGLQFYSGNFLDGSLTGKGAVYDKHGGVAFEPQHYPNAINTPHFPSILLQPGQVYRQVIEYRFSAA